MGGTQELTDAQYQALIEARIAWAHRGHLQFNKEFVVAELLHEGLCVLYDDTNECPVHQRSDGTSKVRLSVPDATGVVFDIDVYSHFRNPYVLRTIAEHRDAAAAVGHHYAILYLTKAHAPDSVGRILREMSDCSIYMDGTSVRELTDNSSLEESLATLQRVVRAGWNKSQETVAGRLRMASNAVKYAAAAAHMLSHAKYETKGGGAFQVAELRRLLELKETSRHASNLVRQLTEFGVLQESDYGWELSDKEKMDALFGVPFSLEEVLESAPSTVSEVGKITHRRRLELVAHVLGDLQKAVKAQHAPASSDALVSTASDTLWLAGQALQRLRLQMSEIDPAERDTGRWSPEDDDKLLDWVGTTLR